MHKTQSYLSEKMKLMYINIRHRNVKPRRKRKYKPQSLQSTFRGHNIDRTTMNHVSAAIAIYVQRVASVPAARLCHIVFKIFRRLVGQYWPILLPKQVHGTHEEKYHAIWRTIGYLGESATLFPVPDPYGYFGILTCKMKRKWGRTSHKR